MDLAASPICSSTQADIEWEPIAGERTVESRGARAAAHCKNSNVSQPFDDSISLRINPSSDNRQPANLDALPIELLLQVSLYLPPSSRVSLHYVSRYLYDRLGYRMADFATGHAMSPRMLSNGTRRSDNEAACAERTRRAQKLQLLCMLERDLLIRKPRVVCSGCFSTHDISLFTPGELAKSGFGRVCVGRVGRMWICPKTAIRFDQLEVHDFWRERYRVHKCSTCVHQHIFSASGFKIIWPLIQASSGAEVPILQLKQTLRRLDIQICPHFRSGNPVIFDSLAPKCRKNRWKSPFERCSCGNCFGAKPYCSICGMRVNFNVSLPHGYQRRMLVMEIERGRAFYKSATDPNWIAQTVSPEALPSLRGR